jgi:hypothetical protein
MPDVLIEFNGLRLHIEGKVGDSQQAHENALIAARERVNEGIAHIGVAVVYPASLRESRDLETAKNQLLESDIDIAVITEARETEFVPGRIDYVEQALRDAFSELVAEDVVTRAVAALDAGVEEFAAAISNEDGTIVRIADVLGIRELPDRDNDSEGENE